MPQALSAKEPSLASGGSEEQFSETITANMKIINEDEPESRKVPMVRHSIKNMPSGATGGLT